MEQQAAMGSDGPVTFVEQPEGAPVGVEAGRFQCTHEHGRVALRRGAVLVESEPEDKNGIDVYRRDGASPDEAPILHVKKACKVRRRGSATVLTLEPGWYSTIYHQNTEDSYGQPA